MALILVVDQDDIVAELAAGILASAGHLCGFACSAAEAWQMLQWRRPDLMLVDETLPDEDGPFLRRLHGSPAWRDLPVILLTAASTAAPDCLGKPLQPRILLEQVARTLERRPARWAEFQLHRGTDDSPRRVYL